MQMVLFGLLNYEDYILKTVLTSSYAKNTLTILLIYLTTSIVKFHLAILFAWLFAINNSLDYVTPIIINVIFSFLSNTMYQYISTHRYHYEIIVDYLMMNYSRSNIIRWKRYALLFIFGYVLFVLLLIRIDNRFLIIGTFQTAISFAICDILDNRDSVRQKVEQIIYKPKVTKFLNDINIIHDYPELEAKEEEEDIVVSKPVTPPLIARHYKKIQ